MEWSQLFEYLGKTVSTLAALGGGWWAIEKWRKRDEHFPRVSFEVYVNFIGEKDGNIVTELVAIVDNKGLVPLKIKDFDFKLRGLKETDSIIFGGESIRGQLLFPHILAEGVFVPKNWKYSFIYPGIKTEYNFVTAIPKDVQYLRMQGDFKYLRIGTSHHAAKIQKVPNFALN